MQSRQPEQKPGGFKLDTRVIIIIVALIAVLFFLTRNNQPQVQATPTPQPATQDSAVVEIPGVELGRIVSALNLDRDGCPGDTANAFRPTDSIYIVAEESSIPEGTALFARLYLGNRTLEDTDEIVAPNDLNACVNFVFESDSGFEPGNYEAEFFVNGNPAGSVAFSVR